MSLKTSLAQVFHRFGISADFMTYCGLLLALFSGLAAAQGRFFWAGAFLLASGGLDMLDGAIARISGTVSAFGGILDSTLDRYGDAFVFFGILYYCGAAGRWLHAGLAMSALVGSFSISYVRARAECEIDDCRVGFWERGERIVFLSIGFLLNNVPAVLWVLGTLTHATVAYRLAYAKNPGAWKSAREGKGPVAFFADTRREKPYFLIKAGVFVALLLFWRPGF